MPPGAASLFVSLSPAPISLPLSLFPFPFVGGRGDHGPTAPLSQTQIDLDHSVTVRLSYSDVKIDERVALAAITVARSALRLPSVKGAGNAVCDPFVRGFKAAGPREGT